MRGCSTRGGERRGLRGHPRTLRGCSAGRAARRYGSRCCRYPALDRQPASRVGLHGAGDGSVRGEPCDRSSIVAQAAARLGTELPRRDRAVPRQRRDGAHAVRAGGCARGRHRRRAARRHGAPEPRHAGEHCRRRRRCARSLRIGAGALRAPGRPSRRVLDAQQHGDGACRPGRVGCGGGVLRLCVRPRRGPARHRAHRHDRAEPRGAVPRAAAACAGA